MDPERHRRSGRFWHWQGEHLWGAVATALLEDHLHFVSAALSHQRYVHWLAELVFLLGNWTQFECWSRCLFQSTRPDDWWGKQWQHPELLGDWTEHWREPLGSAHRQTRRDHFADYRPLWLLWLQACTEMLMPFCSTAKSKYQAASFDISACMLSTANAEAADGFVNMIAHRDCTHQKQAIPCQQLVKELCLIHQTWRKSVVRMTSDFISIECAWCWWYLLQSNDFVWLVEVELIESGFEIALISSTLFLAFEQSLSCIRFRGANTLAFRSKGGEATKNANNLNVGDYPGTCRCNHYW